MGLSLRPDRTFQVYTEVTPQLLQSHGVKLLLCDLDYTIAAKRTPLPDETVHKWINEMKAAGIRIVIISNNRHPKRVLTYCHELGVAYIGRAQKPRRRGFKEAMEMMHVTPRETAMLGDKLLTDVLGARRSGILSLMVEPAGGAVTPWQRVLHAMQAPFKKLAKGDMR